MNLLMSLLLAGAQVIRYETSIMPHDRRVMVIFTIGKTRGYVVI